MNCSRVLDHASCTTIFSFGGVPALDRASSSPASPRSPREHFACAARPEWPRGADASPTKPAAACECSGVRVGIIQLPGASESARCKKGYGTVITTRDIYAPGKVNLVFLEADSVW